MKQKKPIREKNSGRAGSTGAKSKPSLLTQPPKGRGRVTYERLMKAAGELLGEEGFERLSTNAICARAGLTPPALYRYFRDKYEVLEALARRLLKRQNDAFAAWFLQGGTWADPAHRAASLEDWFRKSVEVTSSEPGAIWTLRALRAVPKLAHIRLESQRQTTDQMFEFYRRIYPDIPSEILWCRVRVVAEFGFVVDELALEEDRVPPNSLFHEAARVLGIPYDYEPPGSKPLGVKSVR
jgi:AcrR family transcriptional regulator